MMTIEEWCAKAEWEGLEYAVTEYGLDENDLDDDLIGSEFYNLVKNYRRLAEAAAVVGRQIEEYMDES